MMTASRSSTARSKAPRPTARPRVTPTTPKSGKRTISATERWVLISRNVYARAQQRGFVGGDPLADLAEAIREIDEEYDTDVKGLLSLTDPVELMEQFQNLFAGYGLGKRQLDRLMSNYRGALEKLAYSNRRLLNGASERSARQASLLRNVTEEAMRTLQSVADNAGRIEDRLHLPGQPAHTIANFLSRLNVLANSAEEQALTENSATRQKPLRAKPGVEIHGAVVKAYDGLTAEELAEAPIAALKGISQANSDKLRSTFGMESIRDLANSRLLEQATGIVTLADEERPGRRGVSVSGGTRSLGELADGPAGRLEGVTPRQARVLRDVFRIRTIRDLADNRFFRIARAIVSLAELEPRPESQ